MPIEVMKTPAIHLYRSLLRELRLSSNQPRAKRSPIVQAQFRTIVDTYTHKPNPDSLYKILDEASAFIRSTRIHAELLKRYNPLHDMSQEEKVHASARRVGLNSPVEYKPE